MKSPMGRDGGVSVPVRSSSRLRKRPQLYSRACFYYSPTVIDTRRRNTKKRSTSSRFAKTLLPRNRSCQTNSNSVASNLRRSTRKRRPSANIDVYLGSSESNDSDMMRSYRPMRKQMEISSRSHVELSSKRRKIVELKSTPRREGLRPRHTERFKRMQPDSAFGNEHVDSGDMSLHKTDKGNEIEEGTDDHGQIEAEDDVDDYVSGSDDGDDDEDDDDEDDEHEGRRRYDLRNRDDVRRLMMNGVSKMSRPAQKDASPRIKTKASRDAKKNMSHFHRSNFFARDEDSDDSLLVDDPDHAPVPWARGGSRAGHPLFHGGLDLLGTPTWGLNFNASGWGHLGDFFPSANASIQTAGPSSKGGADIQPLQIEDTTSFEDIGGLHEYVDALKEMVFFPLLYPDFFSSYHIAPPRGVLLCGPPGTGKTLIARALASAASKCGQKVNFYMRKGADILSKWVGEAERQLKLLFEEAQRNQPSIIFFDEIDGLAPVRSSKQEQIHNSIVSTLLALMDGLDSRGQVVLIGATNRVDAVDSALRRPGRFDREFNFPLPGYEARAEIIHIHTRKWKQPPSADLKLELAAKCVGYCGADLKALCTEAAICAFRERYPQVYSSDDKFLIDADSISVEKIHFMNAIETITPAAQRSAIVNSRPLLSLISPCLQRHLKNIMAFISDIFPSYELAAFKRFSLFSDGSAISLVYRPCIFLCGDEDSGLDHLGPAILHELEKFPVHSLSLPSLLSNPTAKSPEEALVHAFGEARRTMPSILYIPNFDLWWENAHEQLKAVLLSLLSELPSNLPILLFGTSSSLHAELDFSTIFPQRSFFKLGRPSADDRLLFFEHLVEVALSVILEVSEKKKISSDTLLELPKAPKILSGPRAAELKAKVETEQHALRRMRMCLRDVCNRILYDKRFNAFHYPVMDEDAPNYRRVIQNPLDMATMLQRVDTGQHITCSSFLQDIELIVQNAKAYNGNDYGGARIVSRAYELRDVVHGMLAQVDPALVSFCDRIAAQGGPQALPDELQEPGLSTIPIMQSGITTRASARLRNLEPEVSPDQRSDALKKQKRNADASLEAQERSQQGSEIASGLQHEGHQPESADSSTNDSPPTACVGDSKSTALSPEQLEQAEALKKLFVIQTEGYGVSQLERLFTRVMKGVFGLKSGNADGDMKCRILNFLAGFAEDVANF